jgi:hypothetical protein
LGISASCASSGVKHFRACGSAGQAHYAATGSTMKTKLFHPASVVLQTPTPRQSNFIRQCYRRICASWILPLLLMLPVVVQAQFDYDTNEGTITITGYTGSGGAVTVPNWTNGYPVTVIEDEAFAGCTNQTSISIGTNITNIGVGAFERCSSLTAIQVDTNNPAYSSIEGVLFDKSQTSLVQYPGGKVGAYTIPNTVTTIGENAFFYCSTVTSVMVPNSVTNIETQAFGVCANLTAFYFKGNAPTIGFYASSTFPVDQ